MSPPVNPSNPHRIAGEATRGEDLASINPFDRCSISVFYSNIIFFEDDSNNNAMMWQLIEGKALDFHVKHLQSLMYFQKNSTALYYCLQSTCRKHIREFLLCALRNFTRPQGPPRSPRNTRVVGLPPRLPRTETDASSSSPAPVEKRERAPRGGRAGCRAALAVSTPPLPLIATAAPHNTPKHEQQPTRPAPSPPRPPKVFRNGCLPGEIPLPEPDRRRPSVRLLV
jgi:hypothetical protein